MTPEERAELLELEAQERLAELRQKQRRQRDNDKLRGDAKEATRRLEESLIIRQGGRSAWSADLLERRWREACLLVNVPVDSAKAAEIAHKFRGLDGVAGVMTAKSLADLRRRYLAGGMRRLHPA